MMPEDKENKKESLLMKYRRYFVAGFFFFVCLLFHKTLLKLFVLVLVVDQTDEALAVLAHRQAIVQNLEDASQDVAVILLTHNASKEVYKELVAYNEQYQFDRVIMLPYRDSQLQKLGILPTVTEANKKLLLNNGIAKDKIEVIHKQGGTFYKRAEILEEWMNKESNIGVQIFAFTPKFSSRYVNRILNRKLSSEHRSCLSLIPVASENCQADNWYLSRTQIIQIGQEHLKNLYSLFGPEPPEISPEWDPEAYLDHL